MHKVEMQMPIAHLMQGTGCLTGATGCVVSVKVSGRLCHNGSSPVAPPGPGPPPCVAPRPCGPHHPPGNCPPSGRQRQRQC